MKARAFYEREGLLTDRYDSQGFWDRRYHRKRLKILTEIVSKAGTIRESDVILDAGCGAGELCELLKHLGVFVVGLDISLSYLKRARGSADELILGSVEMLPIKQGALDFVICADVIEHVDSFDEAVAELFRVSRRNVLITTPNRGLLRRLFAFLAPISLKEIDSAVGHKHIFPLFLLCRKLVRRGWKISYSRSFHVLQPLADKMLSPKFNSLIKSFEMAGDSLIPYHGTVSAVLLRARQT